MRLDILPIRAVSGEVLPFDYLLDLTELELYGERPIPGPVRVSGFAQNRADMFLLHMDISFHVVTRCARCLKPLDIPTVLHVDRPMADHVENEEDSEDILVLENGTIDLDEVAREAVVLEAQMSYLCREDCAGLCPSCGADLNEGPCGCPPEVDERFAALADLFRSEE